MIRKVLRVLGILVIVAVVAIFGGYLYIKNAYPNGGAVTSVLIKPDAETVARGKYLATNVSGCVNCHTPRKVEIFGIPYYEDSIGKGGLAFTHDLGFPGTIYSRNITPAGIGSWSDAQLYHTITTGVDKNGEALFPVMPYPHIGKADPEDVKAIIAYIRTISPIENNIPNRSLDFPVNLIVRTIPKPAEPQKRPPVSDTLAYGKYMFNLAACEDCHTPRDDKGQFIESMMMAGGYPFKFPMGTVRSANLTPDIETGIGSWTKNVFITAFKNYDTPEMHHINWKDKGYQTVMPWMEYCGMTVDDLGAIYTYLRTLKPVKNKVVKWTPAAEPVAMK